MKYLIINFLTFLLLMPNIIFSKNQKGNEKIALKEELTIVIKAIKKIDRADSSNISYERLIGYYPD